VKQTALGAGLPVLTPENVNSDGTLEAIRLLQPDLIVVVAYGQILARQLLEIPPEGIINIHASLLPKYRGAAPVQWAIANGEKVTGVTALYVNEKMDAGDIIQQREVEIAADDTGGTLAARLAREGADLLIEVLDDVRMGRARRRPQNEAEATYAPKLKKSDGKINWTQTAIEIHNRVRGFNPWPGSYCIEPREGKLLKVLRTRCEDGFGPPGQVLDCSEDGLLVATGGGALRLLELQPEGGRPMTCGVYLRGHAIRAGDMFA